MIIQAYRGDDSEVGSPRVDYNLGAKSSTPVGSHPHVDSRAREPQVLQHKAGENGLETSPVLRGGDSYRSMGQILSSMDQGLPLSVPGLESNIEKTITKPTSSNLNAKRSTFWGRNSVSLSFSGASCSSISYMSWSCIMQMLVEIIYKINSS